MLGLQTPVTIVGHRRVLIGAGRRSALVLTHQRDLIAGVVGVYGSRINTTVLPVQYFGLNRTTQNIGIYLLLAPFGCAVVNCPFIRKCHDLATCTATAAIARRLGSVVWISRDQRPAFPVEGLISGEPARRSVITR